MTIPPKTIDLNCDMGEGFGAWQMGDDMALLDCVTSANVACGFHAGDFSTMARVVAAAVERGVAVGAHPSLPDLQGFGRRAMQVSEREVYEMTIYQVGALSGFCRAAGTRLHHVKIHGMLYNMAARDEALSRGICRAVRDMDDGVLLYVLSGSLTERVARGMGLGVACEVFADRGYQSDGTLTPRGQPGAMITDVEASIAQVRGLVHEGRARSVDGQPVAMAADTVCVHGDQPGAVEFARRLREALAQDGVAVAAPGRVN